MANETIDELIDRVHEALGGHGLHIDTHQTEPKVVVEYESTSLHRATGESLEGVLRAILKKHGENASGPVTMEIDLDNPDG